MVNGRDQLVACKLAEGKTKRQVAKEMGMSESLVNYISKKDDIKDIVQRSHARLISHTLEKAVDNIDYAVTNYKKTKDKQLKEHGYKASEKVLEAAGLLSSHNQSIVHQTYINQQTNITNPVIDALITKHLSGFALDKPIWEIEGAKVEEAG